MMVVVVTVTGGGQNDKYFVSLPHITERVTRLRQTGSYLATQHLPPNTRKLKKFQFTETEGEGGRGENQQKSVLPL